MVVYPMHLFTKSMSWTQRGISQRPFPTFIPFCFLLLDVPSGTLNVDQGPAAETLVIEESFHISYKLGTKVYAPSEHTSDLLK